jgi:hypothetical protein
MPRATDMLSALLAGRFYWGPYDGGFSERTGCHILPSVGHPCILIPDTGGVRLKIEVCFISLLLSRIFISNGFLIPIN